MNDLKKIIDDNDVAAMRQLIDDGKVTAKSWVRFSDTTRVAGRALSDHERVWDERNRQRAFDASYNGRYQYTDSSWSPSYLIDTQLGYTSSKTWAYRPLNYAIVCGHREMIALLIDNNIYDANEVFGSIEKKVSYFSHSDTSYKKMEFTGMTSFIALVSQRKFDLANKIAQKSDVTIAGKKAIAVALKLLDLTNPVEKEIYKRVNAMYFNATDKKTAIAAAIIHHKLAKQHLADVITNPQSQIYLALNKKRYLPFFDNPSKLTGSLVAVQQVVSLQAK